MDTALFVRLPGMKCAQNRKRASLKFCGSTAAKSLPNSATGADRYRASHKDTGGWHFMNVPPDAKHVALDRDCGEPAAARITLNTAMSFARGQAYQDRNYPIVQEQLARGGVRLGQTLNDIFDPQPPK